MRKYILAAVLILILVIAGAAYYIYNRFKADPPELSARTGDLTFMSDRDGTWDIFLLDQEETLHNLTQASSGHEYFPNYVFEGTKLNLFSTESGAYTPAVVMSDGTDFRAMEFIEAMGEIFSSQQLDSDPAWSPDGERLLWVSMRDFNPELYLSSADGSNPERLTDDGKSDSQAAWSPDGTKIVFVSDRPSSTSQHVYLLDLASQEVTQLSSDGEHWDWQPVWSMDGTQILFISDRSESLVAGALELYLVNADGTGERLFTEEDVFTGDPTYSPDGEQIAYMSNEEGSWHIYVMDADGSNVRRVTEGESNHLYPVWRPVPASQDAGAESSATEEATPES